MRPPPELLDTTHAFATVYPCCSPLPETERDKMMTFDREANADDLQAAHFIAGQLSGDVDDQILFGLQSGQPSPDAMCRVFEVLFPELELNTAAVLDRLQAHIGELMEAQFDEPEGGTQ